MRLIPAKTILSGYTEQNPWFGNNYNMNLYKGCSHGCIYCDSRSECYQVENFDEVRSKEKALTILERELRGKRRTGVIGMGAMSDPYNPMEKEHCLTLGALKLINRYRYGVSIATKSDLIVRDADLLCEINTHSPVLVKVTITAANDLLCKKIEPNVAPSSIRFNSIKALAMKGLFTGILLMPVLPFIEDTPENILGIINLAQEHGAKFIYPAFGVTLRQNQRDWYFCKLEQLFPTIKEKYIAQYGNDYECRSPRSAELWELFTRECERRGILYRMQDIIAGYTSGFGKRQLSLF